MKTPVISITAALITAAFSGLAQTGPVPGTVEHELKGTFAQYETQEIDFPLMVVDGIGGGSLTLLGRYTEHEVVEVNLITTVGIGTAIYTAANGDTISTEVVGSAGPGEPGIWVVTEQHTITGGTGRFEGASGEFTVVRKFAGPPGPFSYGYLFGTIVLQHAKAQN